MQGLQEQDARVENPHSLRVQTAFSRVNEHEYCAAHDGLVMIVNGISLLSLYVLLSKCT
jgi:hypothetical protein